MKNSQRLSIPTGTLAAGIEPSGPRKRKRSAAENDDADTSERGRPVSDGDSASSAMPGDVDCKNLGDKDEGETDQGVENW
ncbi:hypothetical protein ACJ41O_011450 [Fusarium nematophilum]